MTSRRSEEAEELIPLPVDRGSTGGPARDRAGLDRSGRTVGLGVLLVALVFVGTLAGQGERRQEAAFVPPAPAASDEPAPEGWRRGAPGPLRHRDFAAQVWTGTELVVWGGDPDGDSGAAYDPKTDRWRAIATAPIPARCEPAAAWSGREVLVWGRACTVTPGQPRDVAAGAAYDPAADRWRVLPASPITAGSTTLSVWTGHEWVVANPAGPAAALEPTGGRWRMLAPEGIPHPQSLAERPVWTGQDALFWVGRFDGSADGVWLYRPPSP